MNPKRILAIIALLTSSAMSQSLRVLSIGDSLTEEYRFEAPITGPVSNPLVANTNNWVEIVNARRPSFIDLGSYNPNLAAYPDLRNGGYKFNYGIPGFRTDEWVHITTVTPLEAAQSTELFLLYSTKLSLVRYLKDEDIDVVVIALGGNDLKSNYSKIYNDDTTPAALQTIVNNFRTIRNFIHSQNSSVKIVIATMPDVGATPNVVAEFPDASKRARVRERIAAANASLITLAGEVGAQVARIDTLTDQIFDSSPFHLNGSIFQYPPNDNNPPDHLFCHDGFHPSTIGQALITNLILDAINRATSATIPLLSHREILADVLHLNPDQPYLTWAGNAGAMTANPDGDGAPNLVEFLLNTSPQTADSPFTFTSTGELSFPTSAEARRFADLSIEESNDLTTWNAVPENRKSIEASGTWRIIPSASPKNFYRLHATPKP